MTVAPLVLSCDAAALAQAADILRDDRLVAFPTETVYGLGADARSDRAVARVFAAKGRPTFNPLIVHVADMSAAQTIGVFDDIAIELADAFWPGPLTIVVERALDCPVSHLVSAGLGTVALRVPGFETAQALLQAFDGPVAAPSANGSGQVSPTEAAHVAESLGDKVAAIVDGGRCPGGLESTVVLACGDEVALLRPGMIPRADIEAVLGHEILDQHSLDAPQSPGQLLRHYAPATPVRLDAEEVAPGEALLAFGSPCPGAAVKTLNLSESGDLVEAAGNLFRYLRALDDGSANGIAVMPIPGHGLGEAINDRLMRAAHA